MRALVCFSTVMLLAGVAEADRPTLRVCADPNNLPFSNAREEGLENRLARIVADALGEDLAYTWLPQRRGFVRNTLKARRCDLMLEVPAGYERTETTRPYYRSSYVFLTRRDRRLALRSLDDKRLATLRIGIPIVGDDYANPPPAEALARRGLGANIVGFPVYGDYSKEAPLARITDAVVAGEIDVAIVWGPLAGWAAQHAKAPLVVGAITPTPQDPPLAFDIAMGVRRGDDALRRRLDEVLVRKRRAIEAALRAYGVPLVASR